MAYLAGTLLACYRCYDGLWFVSATGDVAFIKGIAPQPGANGHGSVTHITHHNAHKKQARLLPRLCSA